ncbi:hypothetical protein ACFXJ5_22000 [Streptomyces sp. NPDC059373]
MASATRRNLHRLAGPPAPPAARPSAGGAAAVSAASRALLGTLDRTPAFVVDPRFDLLTWNPPASALAASSPVRPTSAICCGVFCCPYGARSPANREPIGSIGADLVAGLRAHHADRPADHALTAFVGRLSAQSPAFAALWARHGASLPRQGCCTSGIRIWPPRAWPRPAATPATSSRACCGGVRTPINAPAPALDRMGP